MGLAATATAQNACEAVVADGFTPRGIRGGVGAMKTVDTPDGLRLYVGGLFDMAGDVPARNLAVWDGERWSRFAQNSLAEPNRGVYAMEEFEGDVVIGGDFTAIGDVAANRIARWDGEQWQPYIGSAGFNGFNGSVYSLLPWEGALLVGGSFSGMQGQYGENIARWSDGQWVPMGSLPNWPSVGVVGSLANFRGMPIASGRITVALPYRTTIVQWNGEAWEPLGGVDPMNAFGAYVNTLGVYCDELVICSKRSVYTWDGKQLHVLGTAAGTVETQVGSLAVHDGDLIVGGLFASIDGVAARGVARWRDGVWSPLGAGLGDSDYEGAGSFAQLHGRLIAAGAFENAGNTGLLDIAQFDGDDWTALGGGNAPTGDVNVLAVHGDDVYVGGTLGSAGGQVANHVARWDCEQWGGIGVGVGRPILSSAHAFAFGDDVLYLGGNFVEAGETPYSRVQMWDGKSWQALDATSDPQSRIVYALAVLNERLIAGGAFQTFGGSPMRNIAQWDGTTWSPLGNGSTAGTSGPVRALMPYQGALLVGGSFSEAGGVETWGPARWDGADWTPLYTGNSGRIYGAVYAFANYQGNPVVAGSFLTAGGVIVNHVAQLVDGSWRRFGQGIGPWYATQVNAVAVSGHELIVGGVFQSAGGLPASNLARWDGERWHGNQWHGTDGEVRALAVRRGELYVGGAFSRVDGQISHYFAILRPTCVSGDLNCDAFVTIGDVGGFVLALTEPEGYDALYPDCDRSLADANEDGAVDSNDISAFVALLVSPV
ncbi:MAG: hypothetical protein SF069_10450 [Phycisphaerae bacterium]|nr:hypothetical protein [Phycisphaerae bacterium]